MTTPTELPKYRERVAIEEAFATGWAVTKRRWLPIIGYTCLAIFLSSLPSVLGGLAHDFLERNILFSLLLILTSAVFVSVSTLGLIKMNITYKRGEDFSFDDFLSVGNNLLSYAGAVILCAIVVVTGCLFFIIPGIIFGVRLSFVDYFIIDKKMGPLQAMSASWSATRGCVLMLILFAGAMHLLMTVGMLCLVVGMVPAYMVMMVARAQVYDRLVDTCPELTPAAALGTMTSPEVATSVVSDVVPPAEIVSEVPASATTDVGLESAIPTDAASTSLEASSAAIPVVEPTIESSEKPANPSEPAV